MQFQSESNRIFAAGNDGKLLAEITFPQVSDGVVTIDHTFVDDSLRGQGIASQLTEAASLQIREQRQKAEVACSYARAWFAEHPEASDILV